MLRERVEGKWIDCFAEVFGRCGAQAGDAVAILSETQSRPVNVELAALALHRLGCRPFHLVVPSPRLAAPAPVRSTGASDALQRLGPS
jgi:2,5-dihydroxypyridine 5,6-dioxygenase